MKSPAQLAHQFREVIFSGTWIANTNYKHQLENLDWKLAVAKIDSFNTVAALTFHINYYVAGLVNVFEGGTLDIKDKYSFDCPDILTQQDWEKLLNKFFTDAERFAYLVEKMSPEKLDEIFVNEKYGTYQRNIEAIIEHAYYHLGQIVLIKKMAGRSE
ncbi:MAG: DinB family protein [Bacteroidota bacterium]